MKLANYLVELLVLIALPLIVSNMRSILSLVFLMAACGQVPESTTIWKIQESDLAGLMARPLILGASLSTGLELARSGHIDPHFSAPVTLFLKYHPSERIPADAIKAFPGQESLQSVEALRTSDLSSYSLVFALDLFAWDSVKATGDEECRRRLDSVDLFFERMKVGHMIHVAGTIPNVQSPAQGFTPTFCRSHLNVAIRKNCESQPECHLLDLEKMYEEVKSNADFFIDGIHPSETGTAWIAEAIQSTLLSSQFRN